MSKYAILTRSTKLRVCVDEDIGGIRGWTLLDDEESERMSEGTLLKVIKTTTNTTSESKYVTVQVLDLVQHNPIYEGNVFACPHTHMRKVNEDLWPYIISIDEPERRLQLISNTSKCNWVMYLKLNDIVSVAGELFGGKPSVHYDCIIRYIGPVHELHAVGHFFGLELLNLDNGFSPQSESVPFAIKYMQCDPSLSIFTTADWLAPLSNPAEAKKKFSALDILSGTLGKVVGAIGPNGCGLGVSDEPSNIASSAGYASKKKAREPTARFYDNNEDFLNLSSNMSNKNVTSSKNVTLIDVTDKPTNKNDDKQQPLIDIPPPLTGILKHNTTSSINTTNATINPSTSAITTTTPTIATTSTNDNNDYVSKPASLPSTLFSLEHKNIIVIDQDDIDECTRAEHNIIVVDKAHNQKKLGAKNKQEDVDLAELLGGNWPNIAGDAAVILNKPRHKTTASSSAKSSTLNTKLRTTERKAERTKQPLSLEDATRADPNLGNRIK